MQEVHYRDAKDLNGEATRAVSPGTLPIDPPRLPRLPPRSHAFLPKVSGVYRSRIRRDRQTHVQEHTSISLCALFPLLSGVILHRSAARIKTKLRRLGPIFYRGVKAFPAVRATPPGD